MEQSCFSKDFLVSKRVLITGGAGGIGYEAARALVWLGADVIIADIDSEKGVLAQKSINEESGTEKAHFLHIDITDDKQLDGLYSFVTRQFGFLDVIINNATVAPMGPVDAVSIDDWDKSYAVNLRAPVRLVQLFLPDMKKSNKGIIVFVPSSGAAPYMGAYEVFKTSQVELCNTLVGELEGTDIITYSIGPGLVKTETAQRSIEIIADYMNMSVSDFYKMNENKMIDPETAGTGFALSVAMADRYHGQEIGSIQVLMDAKVFNEEPLTTNDVSLNEEQNRFLKTSVEKIIATYSEQYKGWMDRNIFERQWVLRDFKKTVGMSVDEMKNELRQMSEALDNNDISSFGTRAPLFSCLKKYYERQYSLLQGYEKNPKKLKENSDIVMSWINEVEHVIRFFSSGKD